MYGLAIDTLLPVEIRVRQDEGHKGPHGSGVMYFPEKPDNGDPRGELFSLWENEEAYVTIGGALGDLIDQGNLPANTVKWSAPDLGDVVDKKEFRVVWAKTGLKIVKLEIAGTTYQIRFNVPETGTLKLHDDALKNKVGQANWALCGALGVKARTNVILWTGQNPGSGGTEQDALRHSTWNLLSAAAIGKAKTIDVTTANEHTGRLDQKAFSSNATMDLYNNDVGATEGGKVYKPGGTQVDTLQAFNHMRGIFNAGNLRAWTPPNKNVSSHDHMIRKSDQKTIYPK